jgi:hypothetical protein
MAPYVNVEVSSKSEMQLNMHTSSIIDGIKKNAPRGMNYQDPTRSIRSEGNADAFVDDTRIGFNNEKSSPMDILTMLQTLTEYAQLWEQLPFATGGALKLSKCYYQLLH